MLWRYAYRNYSFLVLGDELFRELAHYANDVDNGGAHEGYNQTGKDVQNQGKHEFLLAA